MAAPVCMFTRLAPRHSGRALCAVQRKKYFMSKFTTAVKRGIRAAKDAMGPQKYRAGGKSIVCPHCGCDRFDTVGISNLPLGWIIECSRCTMRLFFTIKPDLD